MPFMDTAISGSITRGFEISLQIMQADVHLQQAQMAHRSGRLQDAEHHYRQALQMRPDIAEVNFSLAAVLMLQGKLEDALKVARV